MSLRQRIQLAIALYMALAAALTALLIGLAIADQVAEKYSYLIVASLEFHPWSGFLVWTTSVVLLLGVIVVIMTEVLSIYQKWMRWSERIIDKISREGPEMSPKAGEQEEPKIAD